MDSYDSYLKRALDNLPEISSSKERFEVPKPKLLIEGKTTVLENFTNIVNKLSREREHVFRYLLRELGTAGKIDNSRAIFQGRFTSDNIESILDDYVNEYVICSECGRPDTNLIKSDRVLTLKCDACGAHRPVKKKRQIISIKKDTLEEGTVLEVKIEGIGHKGDGIAKYNKYTIFVPRAVKGSIVKIRIKKVSGNMGFAELI